MYLCQSCQRSDKDTFQSDYDLSWPEMVEKSIDVAVLHGLSNNTPNPFCNKIPFESVLNVKESGSSFPHGNYKLPYIGSMIKLKEAIPLESLDDDSFESVRYVRSWRETVSGERRFIVELTDGKRRRIVLFGEDGSFLFDYKGEFKKWALSKGQSPRLVAYQGNKLDVYKIDSDSFILEQRIHFDRVAEFLRKDIELAKKSAIVRFSDIYAESKKDSVNVWLFNVTTTAFPPSYLHLKFKINLNSGGAITEICGFGSPTIADRLPIPEQPFSALRLNDEFWVPRKSDSEIDVYGLDGEFKISYCLNNIPPSIGGLDEFNSDLVLNDTLAWEDPSVFYRHYTRYPMVHSVSKFGSYILVTRRVLNSSVRVRVYDIIDPEKGVVETSFWGMDFYPEGDFLGDIAMVFPGSPEVHKLPSYFGSNPEYDQKDFISKRQLWLLRLVYSD